MPPAPDAPARTTALVLQMGTGTFNESLRIAMPHFKEEDTALSEGALALARWLSAPGRARWSDIEVLKATSTGEAFKDIANARGFKVCAKGDVTGIQVDRSLDPPLTWGTMWAKSDIVLFVAAGSTTGIVRGVESTFCGVVAELNSYKNTVGGRSTAIVLIGLFDIPANRGR